MDPTLRGDDQQQSAAPDAAAMMIDSPSNWLQSFTTAAAAAAKGAAQHRLCARTHSANNKRRFQKVSSTSVRLRQPDDLTPEGVQRLLLILAIMPPSLSKASCVRMNSGVHKAR